MISEDDEPLSGLVARAFPVAASCADLFLASARTVARQYWLPPWHESASPATYGMLVHAGTYDEVDQQARWSRPITAYAIRADHAASPDTIDDLLARTAANEDAPVDGMLLADAMAAVTSGRSDTASAVLFAAMAAEVKIKRTLLRNAGQLLEAILENPRDLPTSTGQLLGRPMKTAVGKSLAEELPDLYRDVTERLFPFRNDVVHRGSRPRLDEARSALDIATRLFAWLDSF